jgi:alpha-beta hydrolase superfamily lysophospholipase
MNEPGDFQRHLSLRLAAWSACSVAGGSTLILWGGAMARGAGIQALAWGAVEASLALAGLVGARRALPTERGLRRALWIHSGLDLACLAAALLLILLPGPAGAAWRGHGWGLAAIGASLFLLHLIHAQSVPPPLPYAYARAQAFVGPEHRPFLLAGGRPAALLVHDLPGTPAEMLPLGLSLQKAGWTAQAVSLPGFGTDLASLASRGAQDWLRCIDSSLGELRRRHSPLLLVGFSLGGALAVMAASGASLDGLVLLAPLWRLASGLTGAAGALLRPFLPRYFYPLRRADLRDPDTREFLSALAPGLDPEDPATAIELPRLGVPVRLLAEALASGRRSYRRAARVRCPTLILQGSHDELARPDFTRRLSGRFRRPARYLELPAGHRLLAERGPSWSEVERAVLEFAGALRNVGLQTT